MKKILIILFSLVLCGGVAAKDYDVYVTNNTFFSVEEVNDIVKTLKEATKEDVVILHVNSFGGRTIHLWPLQQAISNSKARVVAQVDVALSAAARLLTYIPEVYVKTESVILIHPVRLVDSENHKLLAICVPKERALAKKLNIPKDEFESCIKESDDTLREFRYWLTFPEVLRYYDGDNLWFSGKQLLDRGVINFRPGV